MPEQNFSNTTTVAPSATVPPTATEGSTSAVQTPSQAQPQVPAQDLVSRVSQFKPPAASAATTPSDDTFDFKEIEAIKDPAAKEQALKAYKSMQSGFNKKFEHLAQMRKELEARQAQPQPRQVWTADKIQSELLSDPTFVAEAQRLAAANPTPANPRTSGMSDNEWSALTPDEKAKFNLMEQKLASLEQQNIQSKQQAQSVLVQQQHQVLKGKFANYDSDYVDVTVHKILEGKEQIGLEHIWKALDYEAAVNRAYALGLQDATTKVKDKIGNMSYDGGQVNGSKSTLEPEKHESGQSFFRRLAINRLAEVKSGTR